MKRTIPLLPLALAALAACGGGRPSKADYLALAPLIVQFMEADARANMLGQASNGPLWVDGKGFAALGGEVTGDTVSRESVLAAIGRGNDAEPRQVLLADEESGFGGRWVREYGIYVSPNVGRATADQVTAFVGNYVTDRRAFPTDICDRVWRLRFRKGADGKWALTDRELRRDCRADDAAESEAA